MRKSSAVPLTLLAVAALATGCHDRPVSRNCVDAQGRIVPDTNCNTGTGGGGGMGYHYIYGGSSGGRVGDAVVGGSTSESGVSRGGFGGGGGEGGE